MLYDFFYLFIYLQATRPDFKRVDNIFIKEIMWYFPEINYDMDPALQNYFT